MTRSRSVFLFATVAVLGCTPPPVAEDVPAVQALALPEIGGFESPHWTGKAKADDPVVATVQGMSITKSMLESQLELAGPDAKPADVLNRMIEFELLARSAFERGYYTADLVGDAYRRTMARRWVEHTFDEELRPETMPQSGVEEVFAQAKGFYDHYTRFHVFDAQVLCCTSMSDQDSCYRDLFDTVPERREHLTLCFETLKPQLDALREKLAEAKTTDEYKKLFDTWALDFIPDALRDTFQLTVGVDDYRFQYDINQTYEKQFEKVRYRMFYKEIMDGAKDAWLDNNAAVPVLTPVVQTPIGFHLLFIHQVDPERHLTATDPLVQKEIRANAFETWRRAYFARTVGSYCEKVGCEVNRDGLLLLQEAEAQ